MNCAELAGSIVRTVLSGVIVRVAGASTVRTVL